MSRTLAGWAALVVAALTLAYWLGSATPAKTVRPSDDRLGPQSGEPVGEYLDQARRSLAGAPSGEYRWALVSAEQEWTPAQVWDRLGSLDRIGRVLLRVPIDGVATPTVTVAPGQSAAGVAAAGELAALAAAGLVAPGPRGEAIARVTASRLRAGVPAVVGVVVRGEGEALRAVAGRPGVRAVQVLPHDGSRFGLSPLFPSHEVAVEPGPDDRPVPTS
ncbi:hypothetical protein GCM10027289_05500 [Tsukamurella serpentis]